MKIPTAVIELLQAHRRTYRRMAKHLFIACPPKIIEKKKISESFNVELRFPSYHKGNILCVVMLKVRENKKRAMFGLLKEAIHAVIKFRQ
jgi:hypothetical protein